MSNSLLYLTASIFPSRRANCVHSVKMANAFSNYYDVAMVARSSVSSDNLENILKSDYLLRENINVYPVYTSRYVNKILNVIQLIFILLRNQFDYYYGRHMISLFVLMLLGKEYFVEIHALPTSLFQRFVYRKTLSSGKCKGVVCISSALALDLRQWLTIPNSKVLVAHDGADAVGLKEHRKAQAVGDVLHVGYVGQLYQGRGIEIIISMAQRFKNIKFTIVGGDQELVLEYQRKTRNVSNLQFLGHVEHSQLSQYYHSFDLVLAPYVDGPNQAIGSINTSRWMSPLKIFEYMSWGIPIIVSDLSVLREILNDQECYFVKTSEVNSWEETLNLAINDPLRHEKSAKAKETFHNYFTWEKRAQKISKFISGA